jgi:CBS-domain-containing membrane protein
VKTAVKDVMTTRVVWVRRDASFKEMAAALRENRDQGKARGTTAGELMTQPAVTVTPEDTIEQAARLMYARKVKRLPVTDTEGRLAGIVSRADLLAVFDRPDQEIHREISQDLILSDLLVDPEKFMVSVKDGVVTLVGFPSD